jgi:hypothetical protein
MPEGKPLVDLRREARAALKHFLKCLRKLLANSQRVTLALSRSQTM